VVLIRRFNMPIITISRGSYSKGKAVAEKVAQKLGYECISREIVLEASEEFNVPELKLLRAIHDAPGILDRLSFQKERYIAFVQTALLKHFRKDNLVYHGLAGHFFVTGISHVLKVRIVADLEDRVRLEMEREGMNREEALNLIEKDDKERRKWSEYLYGMDTSDPTLYDLFIHIHKIGIDDAVDIICRSAALKAFQRTPESAKRMEDLVLAAEVRAALTGVNHGANICAEDGMVFVRSLSTPLQQSSLIHAIEKTAGAVPGVKEVKIDVEPIVPMSE
jgi:cytidylate kinase